MKELIAQARSKLMEWGPDKCLLVVAALLLALLVLQPVRCAVSTVRLRSLSKSLESGLAERAEREGSPPFEDYDPILKTALLGKPRKDEPPPPMQPFGILGNEALIGKTPDDAQSYAAGAKLPSGETVVEVGTSSVVLEKDGEKRTVHVFPELTGP